MLHSKAPVAVVESVELPQLLVTVTTGVAGLVFGAATAEAAVLAQPLSEAVTVYVPADVTVIVAAVSPVLHNRLPV